MEDLVLAYMVEEGIAPTVQNYLQLAYLGDVESLDDLGPEDLVEVEALIAEGKLGIRTDDGKVEFRLPVDEEG